MKINLSHEIQIFKTVLTRQRREYLKFRILKQLINQVSEIKYFNVIKHRKNCYLIMKLIY